MKKIQLYITLILLYLCSNASLAQENDVTDQLQRLNTTIQNSQSDTAIAKAYYNIAEIYYNTNLDTVFNLCNQSIKIIKSSLSLNPSERKKHRLQEILAKNYYLLGIAYFKLDNYKKAIVLNEKVIYLLSELDNLPMVAETYNNLGTIFTTLGDLNTAYKYYMDAIKVLEKTDKKRTLAYAYNNASVMLYKLEKFELAETYVKKSIKIHKENDDDEGWIQSTNTYGSLLKKKGDTIQALEKFNSALAKSVELGFQKGIAIAYNNIGVTYMQQKQYEKALSFITKSMDIVEAMNYKFGIINTLRSLGDIYFELGDLEKSESALNRALELAQPLELTSELEQISNTLSKVHIKKKNWKKAYEMASLYYNMQKNVLEKNRIKELTLTEIKAEAEKAEKEKEIKKIEAEKEIAIEKEKNRTQRIYIIFVSIGLLIAGFFSLLLYIRLRSSRKQKDIIEKQNKEQKVLLQEVHHRVKNNFQIISSLLKLQSIQENDPKIEKEFNKAINRISSMAVVHEVIYGQTEFSKIDVRSYFEKLIFNLERSVNEDGHEVDFDFSEVSDTAFNMQTLIPLGISVNELITNAIKHAFDRTAENCKIQVSLINKGQNEYQLVFKDNGKGIPKGNKKSFGLELIYTILDQIDGTMEFESNDQWNTIIKIDFKEQM